MFAIIGATGHIGFRIAQNLLRAGKPVRVIGRSEARLAPLVTEGAEPFVITSVLEIDDVTRAFEGAEAAYTMVPPISTEVSYYQAGRVMAEAAARSGVGRIVNLSGIGAHLPQAGGPHCQDYADLEAAFEEINGLDVLNIRAAFFMTSFFNWIPQIESDGAVSGLLRGDLAIPRIAARDIAEFAAKELHDPTFTGKTRRELLGQRDLSMDEAAAVIGEAIGCQSLRYVELSPQESINAQIAKGRSKVSAEHMNAMYHAWNTGAVTCGETRSSSNTTSTSFEAFVSEEFLPMFRRTGRS
ncbi:uncharacterized protein YbjT (DUF2867 family) [Rhodoligotrophos appendicifer]|uniref:NmrA family NAD(P)-binding protein n=1 Tax=Rhodoligotrophos appendicifer TaxID=987056 RepID=UPI0011850598|nr:NmrA family NAD(P)-binding protein [Rhodoligotrophos appendicifer]